MCSPFSPSCLSSNLETTWHINRNTFGGTEFIQHGLDCLLPVPTSPKINFNRPQTRLKIRWTNAPPAPWCGQHYAHVHNHITRAMSGNHEQLCRPSLLGLISMAQPCPLKIVLQTQLKQQFHSTVVAVRGCEKVMCFLRKPWSLVK